MCTTQIEIKAEKTIILKIINIIIKEAEKN
jgi:hypothetical protein